MKILLVQPPIHDPALATASGSGWIPCRDAVFVVAKQILTPYEG